MVCEAWEFRCRSGGCVQSNARCDGVSQCDDGSDEKGCHKYLELGAHSIGSQNKGDECGSESGLYQCANGKCIFSEWLCDHERDCEDGSDEETCSYHNLNVPARMVSTTTIALVTSIICLIIITVSIISVFLVYRRRRKQRCGHSTPSPGSTPPSTAEITEHWPGLLYDLPDGALIREPPPRYTSRQDLPSATNRGFVSSEAPGLSPPPYTPLQCTTGPVFEFSMEPPPSYSLHDDPSTGTLQQAGAYTDVPAVPINAQPSSHQGQREAVTGTGGGDNHLIHVVSDGGPETSCNPSVHPNSNPGGPYTNRPRTPEVDINKEGMGPTRDRDQNTTDTHQPCAALKLPKFREPLTDGEAKSQMTKWMSLPLLGDNKKCLSNDEISQDKDNNGQLQKLASNETLKVTPEPEVSGGKLELNSKLQSQSVPSLCITDTMQPYVFKPDETQC